MQAVVLFDQSIRSCVPMCFIRILASCTAAVLWCADCSVTVWVCAGVDCNVVLVGQTGFCRILAHITISLDYDYKYNYNTAADAEPAGSPSVLWGAAPANTPDAKTLPNKVPDWEQLVL